MANLSEKSPKKGNPKSQSKPTSKSSLSLKKPAFKASSAVKKPASKASLTVSIDKMTVRCRPKTLANLVKDLSVDKRQAVDDIGFGGLLHLKPINIPRPILPLVLDAFGKGDHYFAIEGNKSFLLSKYDVCDCFQLPTGPEPLQLLGTARCKESTQSEVIEMKRVFKARFGILDVLKGVPSGLLECRLRSPDIGIEEFKELFVLFSVSTFLAPTSNGSIDLALLRAVQDVGRISSFDWCSYVFQSTVDAFKNFVDGARTLTGCIPFVLTSYFHRFNYKGEVVASELPLIKHWDDDRLEARAKSESKAGDLGRAPLSDVPYPLSSKADYSTSKTCGYTKQLVLDLPLEMYDDEDIKSKAIVEMKEIVERGELLDERMKWLDAQTRRLEEQEKGINKWSEEVRFKETELAKRKRVMDEQRRGLEEREKDLNEWGKGLGLRETEILEGGTKLEETKKALDGEKRGLEEREKVLNEWGKGLGLKEKEILKGGKQLEERKKALDGESRDAEVK